MIVKEESSGDSNSVFYPKDRFKELWIVFLSFIRYLTFYSLRKIFPVFYFLQGLGELRIKPPLLSRSPETRSHTKTNIETFTCSTLRYLSPRRHGER